MQRMTSLILLCIDIQILWDGVSGLLQLLQAH